ncbi:hypothetical protein [Gracilibacillus dipsosauri]|uniref:Uncharacterized protein n=1 Tax=Gracilibacillus dipsosauri TaxID=178340 RepID=A0A317KSY6_9BACI|nr:hypothetical protein [Gracilibacillus dipsosauri]PWU66555.1 hypothetical protein DLJ74_19215 [Gracilibacillus dipsosauri]
MSEKVKISRKIYNAISSEIETTSEESLMLRHIKVKTRHDNSWIGDFSVLNNLSIEDMAKIIYSDGYEVEEEWKAGDWVSFNHARYGKVTGKIISIDKEKEEVFIDKWIDNHRAKTHLALIEKSTAQEIAQEKKRRFWAGIDREVDEYKHGDFIKTCDDDYGFVDTETLTPEVVEAGEEGILIRLIVQKDPLIFHADDITLDTPVENRLDQ